MNWRFRKSVKLMPGVRLNVGKRGVSLSAGVRGARVTLGKERTTTSVGLPGTGLSHVTSSRHDATEEGPPNAEDRGGRNLLYGIMFIVALITLAKFISWL